LRGGVTARLIHMYESITSLENLLTAWEEFLRGKRKRRDIAEFSENFSENIHNLYLELINKDYRHSSYAAFNISDPKPRNIHKAAVRDRLLHHAIYRVLYPYFDKRFINDSYSCRLNKGTHKAMDRFQSYFRKVSQNNTRTCWVLKCDIKKFFANIDHQILLEILGKHLHDEGAVNLLSIIIGSFHSAEPDKGLPLGNLTSQLLVNIYMNEFDQHMKHTLKVKYYIRYADDFVIFSEDKGYLEALIEKISQFLGNHLKLSLHPDKVSIKTLASGVDFLGWVHFPDHRVLRTVTKRRMLKNLSKNPRAESLSSYLGMLKHGNTNKIKRNLAV